MEWGLSRRRPGTTCSHSVLGPGIQVPLMRDVSKLLPDYPAVTIDSIVTGRAVILGQSARMSYDYSEIDDKRVPVNIR